MAAQVLGWLGVAYAWLQLGVIVSYGQADLAVSTLRGLNQDLGDSQAKLLSLTPCTLPASVALGLALLSVSIAFLRGRPWSRRAFEITAYAYMLNLCIVMGISGWIFLVRERPTLMDLAVLGMFCSTLLLHLGLWLLGALLLRSARIRRAFPTRG